MDKDEQIKICKWVAKITKKAFNKIKRTLKKDWMIRISKIEWIFEIMEMDLLYFLVCNKKDTLSDKCIKQWKRQ